MEYLYGYIFGHNYTPHQPIRLSQLNGAIKMRLYAAEQFH